MAVASGKSAVLGLMAVFGVFVLLFGSILIYEYSDSGMDYKVYLDEYDDNSERIWGKITLKIRNTNNFDVSARNIHVDLYNPDTDGLFFEFFHIGGTIKAGETYSETFEFDVLIDDVPETEIKVKLSAFI